LTWSQGDRQVIGVRRVLSDACVELLTLPATCWLSMTFSFLHNEAPLVTWLESGENNT
jgi:hypothetical protein